MNNIRACWSRRAVDGFLLLNTSADQISVPVPVVAISAHSAVQNVTNIVLDHHKAVEIALKHLYDLGHRRIAFMRGPKAIPDSDFRWQSIQEVAGEIGLRIDPALVVRIDRIGWSMKTGQHPMAPEIGYKPMQALLEKTRDFTAIFLLQRHCRNRRHSRAQRRRTSRTGRCFRRWFRRHPVSRLLHAIAHHRSTAALRDGPARREDSARSHRATAKRDYPSEIVVAPELVIRESTGPANGRHIA